MKLISGNITQEEFDLRCACYGQVKVEYARKWLAEHGYKDIPYCNAPIRVRVECDKFLDYVMGTDEARKRTEELKIVKTRDYGSSDDSLFKQ